MLTDYEDDFFFEEDKMLSVTHENTSTDNILIEIDKIDCKNICEVNNDHDGNDAENNKSLVPPEEDKNVCKIEFIEEIVDPIMYGSCSGGHGGGNNIINDENVVSSEEQYKSNYVCQMIELERLGMTVTSGSVLIKKDQTNLIGISIGGGAPLCPCLYIVQVFDGTPAAKEGTLQSGDELLGVNGATVKGKTKVEVAKMIQGAKEEVTINYNKLHADPTQGESLDIVLKKIKHRLVEAMSSSTADTLGLSRAILCNDSLVKRLQELEATEQMYKGLVEHSKRMLKAYFDLLQTFQDFGNAFAAISVREPQPRASEAFRLFGELHRNMEKDGVKMLKTVKPILSDLGTYLNKAIPDTKMTIRRYADAKFSYLSYCLKVKEMDDEEHSYAALQEPLYRVETGNYEYRLILRCRQEARTKFAKLRNDVLEKMELLESKHARDLSLQLKCFIEGLATLGTDTVTHLKELPNLFPVEVDLKESAFQYKTNEVFNADEDESSTVGDELLCSAEEAVEVSEQQLSPSASGSLASCSSDFNNSYEQEQNQQSSITSITNTTNTLTTSAAPTTTITTTTCCDLLSGFEDIDLNSTVSKTATIKTNNDDLLVELGLDDIDLTIPSTYQQEACSSSSNQQLLFSNNEDLLK